MATSRTAPTEIMSPESQKSGIVDRAPLLTPKAVAALFAIGELTLANWRCAGIGPDYIKIGSAVRYTHEAIESYLAAQTIKPSVREDAVSHAHRQEWNLPLQIPDRRKTV